MQDQTAPDTTAPTRTTRQAGAGQHERTLTFEGQRWRFLFRQKNKAVLQRLSDGALHTVAWAEVAATLNSESQSC